MKIGEYRSFVACVVPGLAFSHLSIQQVSELVHFNCCDIQWSLVTKPLFIAEQANVQLGQIFKLIDYKTISK